MLYWIAPGAGVFQLVSEKGPSLRISGSPAAMLKVCLASSLRESDFVAEDDLLLLVSLELCHPGGDSKGSARSLEKSFLRRPQRKREILCLPACSISHCSCLIPKWWKTTDSVLSGTFHTPAPVLHHAHQYPWRVGFMAGEGWRPRGIIFYDITTHLESFECLLTYLPIGGKPLMWLCGSWARPCPKQGQPHLLLGIA